MITKRVIGLLLVVSWLLTACFTTTTPTSAVPAGGQGALSVAFLDIGQGDSILIRAPDGETMLIDGGRTIGLADKVIIPQLQAWGADHVDVLIPTHPDADHISGLVGVIENFPVSLAALTGQLHSTQIYERLLTDIRDKNLNALNVRTGTHIPFDPALKVEVLGPDQAAVQSDDTNNASIVIKLTYGNVSFLFTGDAEFPEEKQMILDGADVRSTILKVGHHGSRTSTDADWLSEVAPELAVISVGANNSYGHPHPEVIAALDAAGINTLRTDKHGTITVTTDGSTYSVSTQK